jgi:hypothetical protein
MSIKTQSAVARDLGVSRQEINRWQSETPIPSFFIPSKTGSMKIDTAHPDYIKRVQRIKLNKALKAPRREKSVQKGTKKAKPIDVLYSLTPEKDKPLLNKVIVAFPDFETLLITYTEHIKTESNPESSKEKMAIEKLVQKATRAELQQTIYESEIKREKVKQESIRTLEKQKDLAPVSLLNYFFSFAEAMHSKLFNLPKEISPQLSAFFIAGKDKEAEAFLTRKFEFIVKHMQAELIKALEEIKVSIKEKK